MDSMSYNLTMSTFLTAFIAYFLYVSFLVTKNTYPNPPFPNILSIMKSEMVRFFLLVPLLPKEESELDRDIPLLFNLLVLSHSVLSNLEPS